MGILKHKCNPAYPSVPLNLPRDGSLDERIEVHALFIDRAGNSSGCFDTDISFTLDTQIPIQPPLGGFTLTITPSSTTSNDNTDVNAGTTNNEGAPAAASEGVVDEANTFVV